MSSVKKMVGEIRDIYGLNSPKVLNIMLQISREEFLPKGNRYLAYSDSAVPIGFGQTMSQPYTVAFMTDLLIRDLKIRDLKNEGKVLEIGTGSGYQAAILSKLFHEVYTIEIVPELVKKVKKTLKKLKYKNIHIKQGNGKEGWKEKAPFDAIIITASTGRVPKKLLNQLKENGILMAPIKKEDGSEMTRYIKQRKNKKNEKNKIKKEEFGTFYFVPFVRDRK